MVFPDHKVGFRIDGTVLQCRQRILGVRIRLGGLLDFPVSRKDLLDQCGVSALSSGKNCEGAQVHGGDEVVFLDSFINQVQRELRNGR